MFLVKIQIPNSIFRIKVFVGADFGNYRGNFRTLEELYIKDRPFRNLQTLRTEIIGDSYDIATDSYYASQWC